MTITPTGEGLRRALDGPFHDLKQRWRNEVKAETPPLIKGYLKCGAKLLGAPAWDPDFGCADLPMMLRLSELPDSYRRRFLAG